MCESDKGTHRTDEAGVKIPAERRQQEPQEYRKKMRRQSVMKKVVKFGGSSLASARQFKKVGEIIRADKARR